MNIPGIVMRISVGDAVYDSVGYAPVTVVPVAVALPLPPRHHRLGPPTPHRYGPKRHYRQENLTL
jgi:hypothetical protein